MPNNTARVKKIPQRQCLGCGEHKPKPELVRIVRSPDGEIFLDATGKRSGRGAYVCQKTACLKKVRKSHRVEQNLECEIPDEIWARLEREINEQETHKA